jgi:GT2 family glycosyltransferase
VADRQVDPGSVRFATLVDDEHGLHPNFMNSWNPMLAYDLGREQRIWRGGYTFQPCSSVGVVEGRNSAVKSFLEGNAEWLLFIDADMGWDHDALERLIAVADPVERPIVGGLCFGFGPINEQLDYGMAVTKVPFPTIVDLRKRDDDLGFQARWGYVPNAVQKCDATGAAMLLIHRSVLERFVTEFGGGWFDRLKHPQAKKLWGEDTSFCARAGMLGYPIYVHAGVRTSHAKTIHVTEWTYMRQLVAQPATDEVAVIVPVLNRPQNAEPFMRSLRASTGLAEAYAVCEETDVASQEAWRAAGASLIVTNVTTFAEKCNVGYQNTTEPWLFLVGDDVHFHAGWLDHLQQVARNTGAKVVGSNDLANERVLVGDHATHMLVDRVYIDEQGASWDGPGVVCHEGYRHWFVDDELVTVAKQRNVWAPALASLVEHLHPIVGKAETDAVYELGRKSQTKDKMTYTRRLKANAA